MVDLHVSESAARGQQEDRGAIELGVVGWPGDDDHADVSADDLNGRTLVKVTLLRGGTAFDTEIPDGEARGTRIRCRVKGPDYYVPPKGTEVMIAIPAGFGLTDGAPVIIACMGATPDIQYSKTKAKFDYGPDVDVMFKGRSCTMLMYNPDDPTQAEDFISISPEGGIQAVDRNGFGLAIKDNSVMLFAPGADGDAKTIVRLELGQLTLANKDDGGNQCGLTLTEQEVTAAGIVFNAFTPGANLGAAAAAATPAMTGVGGVASWATWLSALGTWQAAVVTAFGAATPPVAVVFPPLPPPPCAPSATINLQP